MSRKAAPPPTPKPTANRYFIYAGIVLFIAAVAVVIILFIAPRKSAAADLQNSPVFKKEGTAIFYDKQGKEKCRFDIEIADTEEKQKTGLMFRDSMAVSQAMLFVYDKPTPMSFWMKNTYLSLDLAFIKADSLIGKISEQTTPFSENSIAPYGEFQYALEMLAGAVKRFGLEAGDRMVWKRD